MSRRGKGRTSDPEPLSGPMPPLEIIEVYPNKSGLKFRDRLRAFANDLMSKLIDSDPQIVQSARESLKELSGVDHGPEPGAPATDRERAQAAWRQWWDGQK